MPQLRPILLAEDSPKDVELTLAALEGSQFANPVVVVRDGAEALDYLYCRGAYQGREALNPALLILDIQMPKVSGLEVLAALKADPALQHLPAVVLTSSKSEADHYASYDLGANAYVAKPVGFQEFFEAARGLGLFWAVLNETPPRFRD